MQHVRKRVVKVVEEGPPARIAVRLTETNGVIFERAPADKQQIERGAIEARPYLEALEPVGCRD